MLFVGSLKKLLFFTCAVDAPSNKAIQDFPRLVPVFTDRGTTMSCTEGVLIRGTRLQKLIRAASSRITLGTSITLYWTSICWNKKAATRTEVSLNNISSPRKILLSERVRCNPHFLTEKFVWMARIENSIYQTNDNC